MPPPPVPRPPAAFPPTPEPGARSPRDASDGPRGAGPPAAPAVSVERAAGWGPGYAFRRMAGTRPIELGDRRRHDRFPVALPVRLPDGRWTRSIDLSEGGMLVAAPDGPAPRVGARIGLEVEGIGTLPAIVTGMSRNGLHCAFGDLSKAARAGLGGRLDAVRAEYAPLIAGARAVTERVEALIAADLAAGRLTVEALFDTAYRPVPGSDPRQFVTGSAARLTALLQAPLDGEMAADARMAFCMVSDRNGFAPVHTKPYAAPQRAGDPAWNAAHSRNLRIFDDAPAVAAARSQRPATVQAYRCTLGAHDVPVREVDVPIGAAGRPWGTCRAAYRS